jgi:predicted RNA-binding protein with PIN domain
VSSAQATDGDGQHPVALIEPARQQLITIGADLVGRLGAEELPASLRSVARFTPAKRVRFGGTMIAAALDADGAFRARVAEAVEQASPDLAEAVRNGGSTAASDPVDTAVAAYLLRPDGWQHLVAQANARWAEEREHSGATQRAAELSRLRAEVAELKSQLRAEAAQARTAVSAAVAAAQDELADLRKQLRARTGELRAAQRERDEAGQAAAEAVRQANAAGATREAEARRSRGRISELERAIESARRAVRTDRDVDVARLALLVDTLTEAAAGVRRELSLPAPTLRPADTIASADAVHRKRTADGPAALEALLALPNAHLIVDGYNVTKTGYGELALADQRARLVSSLAAVSSRSGAEITVVFDGGRRPPSAPPAPRGVRVLFSLPDEIADDLIRRLVDAEPIGRTLIVVTSDRQVALDVARSGAWTVASSVLLARFGQM